MKRHFAVAALIAAPTALFAQSQLDRLEALSEQMNELMMVKMVEEMVAETGADPAPVMELIPDMSWDAEFRAASDGWPSSWSCWSPPSPWRRRSEAPSPCSGSARR